MVVRYPPIIDLKSQREICQIVPSLAADRAAVTVLPHSKARLPSEPAWSAGELPPDVWACLRARGSALHNCVLEQQGLKSPHSLKSPYRIKGISNAASEFVADSSLDVPRDAPRPPQGAGYIYPDHGGARSTLGKRLRRPELASEMDLVHAAKPSSGEDVAELAWSRKERIAALEDGMERHEEEKLAILARRTVPLRGVQGDAILPIPPAEPPKESRLEHNRRIRLIRESKRSPEEDLRIRMQVEQIMGVHAHERFEVLPLQPEAQKVDDVKKTNHKTRSHAEFQRCSVSELLREAESMLREGASEDQWGRLASQLCAKAYDAEPPEILRMVRALGSASCAGASVAGKKSLMQAADHLIQSLTGCAHDASVELLIEVVETMGDARVGSQAYLDMLMALILARHHRDCQALSGSLALRLASALGRVSTTLRLRPKGVGGASTFTNCKLMEALERRIAARLDECTASDLAQLDDYYITRLCSDPERRLIVERMADLELGFRGATSQYLPILTRLQESIQRELGEGFGWSISREVRNYLTRLKEVNLRQQTPWVLGNCSAR